jgi:hypothetical protein
VYSLARSAFVSISSVISKHTSSERNRVIVVPSIHSNYMAHAVVCTCTQQCVDEMYIDAVSKTDCSQLIYSYSVYSYRQWRHKRTFMPSPTISLTQLASALMLKYASMLLSLGAYGFRSNDGGSARIQEQCITSQLQLATCAVHEHTLVSSEALCIYIYM